MAPPYPTPTARRGSEFTPRDETDLISRLHSDALDTPVSLTRRLAKSRTTHARVNPNLSSSDSEGDANAEPSSQQNRGRQPNHSRSMSNPFPSLFNGRRRQGSASKPSVDVDRPNGGPAPSNRPVQTHKRGNPSMSKDFATGNCMTCASLVKWPKELKVFKCTICMTINDLVPISVEGQGSKQQRHDTSPGPSSSKQPPPSPGMAPGQGPRTSPFGQLNLPISLDQTKYLVRQNLRSYVLRRLRDLSSEAQVEHTGDDWPLRQDRLYPDLAIRTHGPLDITPARKGSVTKYTFDEEPTLHLNTASANSPIAMSRSYPSSSNEQPGLRGPPPNSNNNHVSPRPRDRSAGPPDDPRKIFKQLEDYITNCFNNFECINSSFSTQHPRYASRSASDTPRRPSVPSRDVRQPAQIKSAPRRPSQLEVDSPIVDLDPKLLLLGDVAENGLWWTGQDTMAPKKTPNKEEPVHVHHRPSPLTRSPQLNWADIDEWYSVVNNAAEGWFQVYEEVSADLSLGHLAEQELRAIEQDVLKGQDHTRRLLLKVTENLLKRPGRPIKDPMDLRFLLIIMENPSLHSDNESFQGLLQPEMAQPIRSRPTDVNRPAGNTGLLSGQHSGIVKRILGLISNASPECQNQMITWLARYHAARFIKVKELASGFLTYRMIRQSEKKQTEQTVDPTAGLIPQMQTGRHGGASLHDAIGGPRPTKKPKEPTKKISYSDDWQIKAASRVLSLLFSANNMSPNRRGEDAHPNSQVTWNGATRVGGYFLPPTDFYNSMIDYADLIDDFESWESKRSKFSFCQYPFLLSVWAKTHILEHDARRQMQSKARDAFFDSIMTRRNINQYLVLDVRRDCLVDDSLTAVSSVIGSGGEDLKKGLRISFQGEEGIDAGGLRKEWFLLLIREVFNPDYGMFIYDDDSQYCYFNSNSFEPADQFFLVGVVMGLAIYNSTILDVALPPFAFRKLIASAPSPPGSIIQHRPPMRYTLDDLAEYRPRLANGLKQLLAFDGDVEETFCLDFVIETDRYGSKVQVPLLPGGESKPVTNENRREYVDLYVRHVLDIAVKRQFEPFKRGFYTVCGGNAFSLFRPEEIELLIRGSDEPLDIASLRAVAEYDNWESKQPEETEPVIGWFWETFQQATPSDQRKLLTFVTGSDRIPAMGAASLTIKLSCLGDDCGRYPIARTCFNMLSLWRYASKERLESMLWRAVHESEGFGLK